MARIRCSCKKIIWTGTISNTLSSSIQAGKLATLPNVDEAIVLARAFNNFFVNEWLTVDPRYRLAMSVAPTTRLPPPRRSGGSGTRKESSPSSCRC